MMTRVVSAAMTLALCLSSSTAARTDAVRSPRDRVVIDWNDIIMRTVPDLGGVEQVRVAAIAHLALFEAVNAAIGDYEPYLDSTTSVPGASAEAAAVAAAHGVLVNYLPGHRTKLDLERDRWLATIPEGPAKELGLSLGRDTAAAMILHRTNDGAEPPEIYVPATHEPGDWQLTPSCAQGGLFFHWRNLKPFGLRRGDQFRGDGPPRLTSRRFSRDFNEVKVFGAADSAARPKDRADVARFYAAVQSQNVWNPIARQMASARGLSISDTARLFAVLNMAMNDALIAVIDAKYHYTFWRPETAIAAGDTDDNPGTYPDSRFEPFIATPCHPSYPSAHASASFAARAVLERLIGDRRLHVVLSTPSMPGFELRYTRLGQVTRDIDDARVYGGIHYRFDQRAGARQGWRVGEYVTAHNLRRAGRHGQ